MKRGPVVIAMMAAALLLWPISVRSWSGASGVQTLVTLFEAHRHPDLPLDLFAAGRLGLIKPTWSDSYRYVAYRYIVGPGFNSSEQKALVAMWNERLGLELPGELAPNPPFESQSFAARDIGQASSEWLAARNQVPGVVIVNGIKVYRSAPSNLGSATFVSSFYFPNCNSSAMRTATSTLQTMIGRFGASSPQVKRWVEAQDQVFDNCGDTNAPFAGAATPFDQKAFLDDVNDWRAARNKVPVASTSPGFTNGCRAVAFKAAAIGLDTMISNLGASSPQVEQWVEAQDLIFDKCSHPLKYAAAGSAAPSPAAEIPPPLTDGTRFEQAQRAYQIACANFYSGNFDEAAQMFHAIAADRSSPWHDWGSYLAARATIRKATLSGAKNDPAILAQAQAQLEAIIAAPGADSIKPAARRLLSFVEFRLNPEQRVEQVARALMRPGSGPKLAQNLADYTDMWDDSTRSAGGFFVDDLTDWIASFREYNGSTDHSIAQWKKTASLPWLIAAIAQAPGSDPNAPALIKAAEKVKPGSPAYVTVTFHAARLLIERGAADEARDKLDTLLAMHDTMPRSTVNEVASVRMRVARNLTELLTYAMRTPLGVTDTGDGSELPSDLDVSWLPDAGRLKELVAGPLFDRDGAAVLSRWTPLSIQARAAQSTILPNDLRRRVALAAWTRAVLLGDDATARELAPVVGKLMPELKPSMDAWLAAKDSIGRQFDAAFVMLTHPGMRPYVDPGVGRITRLGQIDDLRDNWWRFPSWSESALSGRGRRPPSTTYPLFLSPQQKKSADDQWRRLSAINAPNLLCAKAIGEARRKPTDERVPQALFQCISAVHLGCSNDQGSDYAKSAFSILHRRYPQSTWALNNRFWYRGGGCPTELPPQNDLPPQ
ncbi:MAG TPA: hypothetical protein VNF29_00620 [Candidatus Binataceae bacterium]|nr:hypothetical protein [Candidatus Binataceae bacterium]